MNPKLDRRFLSLILKSLVLLGIPSCVCQNDQQYQTCRQPFQCGSFGELRYPFWGPNRPVSCGYPGFELNCQGDQPLINIASINYRVLNIDNATRTLKVSRDDLWSTLCPRSFFNTTLNFSLFNFYSPANDQNITLYYGCTFSIQSLPPFLAPNYLFNCSVINPIYSLNFFVTREVSGQVNSIGITCNREISVPVNLTAAQDLAIPTLASAVRLQASLESGFTIQWSADNENCDDCERSGGLCGYNQNSSSFACHCTNGTFESTCSALPIDNGNSESGSNYTQAYYQTCGNRDMMIFPIAAVQV